MNTLNRNCECTYVNEAGDGPIAAGVGGSSLRWVRQVLFSGWLTNPDGCGDYIDEKGNPLAWTPITRFSAEPYGHPPGCQWVLCVDPCTLRWVQGKDFDWPVTHLLPLTGQGNLGRIYIDAFIQTGIVSPTPPGKEPPITDMTWQEFARRWLAGKRVVGNEHCPIPQKWLIDD